MKFALGRLLDPPLHQISHTSQNVLWTVAAEERRMRREGRSWEEARRTSKSRSSNKSKSFASVSSLLLLLPSHLLPLQSLSSLCRLLHSFFPISFCPFLPGGQSGGSAVGPLFSRRLSNRYDNRRSWRREKMEKSIFFCWRPPEPLFHAGNRCGDFAQDGPNSHGWSVSFRLARIGIIAPLMSNFHDRNAAGRTFLSLPPLLRCHLPPAWKLANFLLLVFLPLCRQSLVEHRSIPSASPCQFRPLLTPDS